MVQNMAELKWFEVEDLKFISATNLSQLREVVCPPDAVRPASEEAKRNPLSQPLLHKVQASLG